MSEFSDRILNWYKENARVLPWRGHADPYAVWVSEIMLQQTRVESVIPYFERWMTLFPSIEALAQASEQVLLSAWEGLGYYSRVRNLHKAAKIILSELSGQLPSDAKQLIKLPGIGRYTAAAIASIAFNQDLATLDGNLRRVFARVFDVSLPADSHAGEKILWDLAQSQLPVGFAGEYNQALMDLGSAICIPKKPLCLLCPLKDICLSRHDPEKRPVLKPKATIPHKQKMAAVIIQDEKVLLALRPSKGLLGGMWEFPAGFVETPTFENLIETVEADYALDIVPLKALLLEVRHAYTHFSLTEFSWLCSLKGEINQKELSWVPIPQLELYPMGKVDRAIARNINSDGAR
ncbi:MAG: A/G-specific adenine glycosylase [Chloroflexota bacterium]